MRFFWSLFKCSLINLGDWTGLPDGAAGLAAEEVTPPPLFLDKLGYNGKLRPNRPAPRRQFPNWPSRPV